MPEVAGTVADAFASRIRELEDRSLAPSAVRSYETRGRERPETRVQRAYALPARPRPHPPLEAVSTPEGQDAGLHRPGRRSLPHADDAHARDDRDRARRRPGTASERGPDRGDRPRPRHGPSRIRARGRGRARRADRRWVSPQRAVGADRREAQPDARGRRRDPHAHRASGASDARGKGRAHRRSRGVHQPRHRRRDPLRHSRGERPPGRRDRDPRSDRWVAHRHARPRPGRAVGEGGRHRAERRDRRGDALAAVVHVRARLPRSRDETGAHPRARDDRAHRRASCAGVATRPIRSSSSSRA